ncbi:MAG: sodium:proton antiporter [Candidatus Thermoplasmatota archaeon]|jgi:multicomponent Na+:H+ antiporter subunit B|nr:sodium:proton antiporter [Candidatus Thermoplasmatota archaeon]
MNGMSRIVKTITSIVFPFIMIFGLYIIAHGHLTPGGGFQGGAVVASGCAMILVAYGSVWTMGKIKEKNLSILESIGAICFIILAILGLGFGTVFFKNFLVGSNIIFGIVPSFGSTISNINTAGVIPLMNFAVGLKVIVGLFGIVLIMAYASRRRDNK